MKTKIIVVAGPTASGKTVLGIELAKAVNGEIISADSMQIYRGMPIATAAPTKEEREQAVHHLTEFLDSSQVFSVADWCALAQDAVCHIAQRGKVPIIVGGTGLFIDSLVDHIKFTESRTDFALRNRLMAKSEQELYEELKQVDFDAAQRIHPNNKIRVVRALELYYITGATKTQQDILSRTEESPYEPLYFILSFQDRSVLYSRIDRRVDQMVARGLLQEAQKAYSQNSITARQAIGHKELIPYLEGEISLEMAIENLKKETKHYAKRQITWFRRRRDAVFLEADTMGKQKMTNFAVKKAKDFLNDTE